MNLYLQKFKYSATGRWAVSIRTYLLVFPFGYLVSVERELIFNPIIMSRAALIALAGEMASFLYLFLAQSLLLAKRKERLQPIWRCFFVWGSTGLVRGLSVALYANWAFGYQLDLLKRVPSAAAYTFIVMALAAMYFGTIERRRTELQAINALAEFLEEEEGGLIEQSRERRRQAQEVLSVELLPQLESLQGGISKAIAEGDEKVAGEILRDLYAKSLQISQELALQQKAIEKVPTKGGADAAKSNNRVSYRAAVTPNVLSVRITAIFFSLGSLSGQLPRNGAPGVFAGLLGLFPLMAVVLPFSQIIKRRKGSRAPLFLASFILAYLFSYSYNVVQPSLGFDLTHPYAPWYSALKTVYGLYFASVIASLLVDFGDKREIAAGIGERKISVVNKLARDNFAIEQALVLSKFGTLQGKISGVTMALHLLQSRSLGEISIERKKSLLSNANQLLAESLIEVGAIRIGVDQ